MALGGFKYFDGCGKILQVIFLSSLFFSCLIIPKSASAAWSGQYWNVTPSASPAIPERAADYTRSDENVYFNWGDGSPDAPETIQAGVLSEFVKFEMRAFNSDVALDSIKFTGYSLEQEGYTAIKDIVVYDGEGKQISYLPVSVDKDGQTEVNFNSYIIKKNSCVTFVVKAKADRTEKNIGLRIDNMGENIKSSARNINASYAIIGMDLTVLN